MSVIATLTVPATDFTLGAALSPNPAVRVRLARVVPVGDTFIPYLWASNESVDEIGTELEMETDIASFDIVDELEEMALIRVEWTEEESGFLGSLVRTDAIILEGIGRGDTWRFQLRFVDHDDLTEFYRDCRDRDIQVELESVHDQGVPGNAHLDLDLTDPQREALELAHERGYFDVPRRTNVVELAAELGISDSAVSQRLRRATSTLLETTLLDSPDARHHE